MRSLGHISGEYPYSQNLPTAWANIDGDAATAFIRSSSGISGFADNTTGDYSLTLLYPFASGNYMVCGVGADDGASATSDGIVQTQPGITGGLTTTVARIMTRQRSITEIDSDWVSFIAWGKV